MLKLKLFVASLLIAVSSGAAVVFVPAVSYALPTHAVADISNTDACAGLTSLDPTQDCGPGHGDSGVTQIIKTVINILSYIVGIASVIVVILSGLKYITSNGDAGSISSAKTTLVYALIGLAIAALAQVLVHYVIGQAAQSVNTPPAGILRLFTEGFSGYR